MQFHELDYLSDPSALLRSLGSLPFPALLDSGEDRNSPLGRYSILSALPVATVEVQDGQLISSHSLKETPAEFPDLFAALRWLMNDYQPTTLSSSTAGELLPFTGGALGYIGYPTLTDSGNYQIINAFFGIYLWALVLDHQAKRSVLVFQEHCPVDTRNQVFYALLNLNPQPGNFCLTQPFRADMTPGDYQGAFEHIKDYIRAGDCYQVNLTQRFSSQFSGLPLEAYLHLRTRTNAHHGAFLAWGDQALLSFSPEQFLSVRDRQVMTRPIKGTRPRGHNTLEDETLARQLLASAKDRAENLMIVDLLRNDLGRCCRTGSVRVPDLFKLQSLPNVHHLVSTVQGILKAELSPLDLMACCFPGGSITGAPKIRAMEIIEEVETRARGPYCGSIMYLGFDDTMDSSITIRTAQCQGDQIFCWAGGAIVDESDCSAEYQECMDKINPIINGLEELLQNR